MSAERPSKKVGTVSSRIDHRPLRLVLSRMQRLKESEQGSGDRELVAAKGKMACKTIHAKLGANEHLPRRVLPLLNRYHVGNTQETGTKNKGELGRGNEAVAAYRFQIFQRLVSILITLSHNLDRIEALAPEFHLSDNACMTNRKHILCRNFLVEMA
jgi:hypothetical protein